MSKILMKAFSYLLITLFVAFILYLLQPFFPGVSSYFQRFGEKITNIFNININPQIISIVTAIVIFFVLYILLVKLASLIRKKTDLVWDDINPNIRYQSLPYTIAKIILIIIFVPFIYGYGRALLSLFNDFNLKNSRFFFFIIGFTIFSLIWIIIWKKFSFFSIFEHEFTHMILALCFFHKPKAFYVEEHEGGWVKLAGVNFIITLGPYFFLTTCFLILPFYLIIKPEFYAYYFLLMGISTSYHTLSTIRETNFKRQPDIIFNGKIFSLIVIAFGNIFCYGYVFSFVLGGFTKGREFISLGWINIMNFFKTL